MSRRTTGDEMTDHLAESERRWAEGEKALTIPIGGSDAMGIWGYILAVEELMADMAENALTQAAIVHARIRRYASGVKCGGFIARCVGRCH